MTALMKRVATVTAAMLVAATASLTAASAADASPTTPAAALRGTTEVTTAPGIATTLLGAGIIPLPVPSTSVRIGFSGGLNVTYGFPITAGNPDLAGPSGHIYHSGGINFVSLRGKHLEIGKFDIDLAAGKVFATQVNYAAARIPVLDLDLTNLRVTHEYGATVLTGIGLKLDPAAATALNTTFGTALPTNGSLLFGTGKVTLRS